MPWDRSKTSNNNYVSVGAVSAYKVTIDSDDIWKFERMWTKSFPS